MKYLALIFLFLSLESIVIANDSTKISLIKKYEINSGHLNQVLAINFYNEIVFCSDLKRFLKDATVSMNVVRPFKEKVTRDLKSRRKNDQYFQDTLWLNFSPKKSQGSESITWTLDIEFNQSNKNYRTNLEYEEPVDTMDSKEVWINMIRDLELQIRHYLTKSVKRNNKVNIYDANLKKIDAELLKENSHSRNWSRTYYKISKIDFILFFESISHYSKF